MGGLLNALTGRLRVSSQLLAVSAAGYAVVALLLIFAAAAFIYAAAVALSHAYGPIVAAVVLGAGALLIALVIIAWIAYRQRRLRRQIRMRRLAEPAMADLAAGLMPVMLKASPLGTMVAVAAATYFLQRSRRLRR